MKAHTALSFAEGAPPVSPVNVGGHAFASTLRQIVGRDVIRLDRVRIHTPVDQNDRDLTMLSFPQYLMAAGVDYRRKQDAANALGNKRTNRLDPVSCLC